MTPITLEEIPYSFLHSTCRKQPGCDHHPTWALRMTMRSRKCDLRIHGCTRGSEQYKQELRRSCALILSPAMDQVAWETLMHNMLSSSSTFRSTVMKRLQHLSVSVRLCALHRRLEHTPRPDRDIGACVKKCLYNF